MNPNQILSESANLCPTNTLNNPTNWFSYIKTCISRGSLREALLTYVQIRRCNQIHKPSLVPLLAKACASLSMIYCGKSLHAESIKAGVEFDVVVGTSLVDMYGKCGRISDSRQLFDKMPDRNVVTWNAMVGGYMRHGDAKSGLKLFEQMPMRTVVTWIAMIEGYARLGDTVSARQLFDQVPPELRNVVIWTVMVEGYAANGEMEAAKEVFEVMPMRNCFAWSSMISGYFKTGRVQEGKAIFDRIPARNLVNWNSLISGYAQNGLCGEALDAFRKMQDDGFEPDEVTYASVLSASAQSGLLDAGNDLHQMMIRKRVKPNQFILNGLVDMYAKCGDLTNARLIFDGMLQRNKACWNSMISGFAIHGHCKEAIDFFHRMEQSTEKPNEITYLSVLSACGHAGFVKDGLEIFLRMEKYGLTANVKHFGCLIDLLGRAGRLREAYDLMKRMPMKANDTIWGALLGACRIHSDTDMANQVIKHVGERGSGDDSHYVLLSNIYAASQRWEKAERMKMAMSSNGFQKTPGCSSLVVNSTEAAIATSLETNENIYSVVKLDHVQ